jgi:hypothetical protein
VSFTRRLSALGSSAGTILEVRAGGHHYVSLDLAGKEDASGSMFTPEDLQILRRQGMSWAATPSTISIREARRRIAISLRCANQQALELYRRDVPGLLVSKILAGTKQLTARRFDSCRGGGQTFNTGITDLNYLRAFFIEQAHGNLQAVRDVVDANRAANGWLIFATHDVCDKPSPYGCTPAIFEAVVEYAVQSGAGILPVTAAVETLRGNQAPRAAA